MNKSLIIFGIVNITSDSFSDGGRYLAPDAAIAQARKLMAEGADVSAGIKRNRLVLDPGMGFFLGAAPETSLSVLARFDELRLRFDLPVLLSVSRKSFLRALTGRGPGDVGAATLAAELAAAAGGADFIRTHEPRPLRDGLAVLAALKETARIR
uniref:dihydropteroate synthase n=1 Tax=Klebsiella pneumoniae TaxID=573 RepID=UPI0039C9507E